MLGRKQSMKGDEVLADYGAGETLTQLGISGDVEWVSILNHWHIEILYFHLISFAIYLLLLKLPKKEVSIQT